MRIMRPVVLNLGLVVLAIYAISTGGRSISQLRGDTQLGSAKL